MNVTESFLDYFERRIKEDREASFFVFLTALSKDSSDPQNLFLKGDSGIGKTYCALNVVELFEDSDVWILGSLSPTALVHSYGELQDAEGNPIMPDMKPSLDEIKEQNPNEPKGAIRKEYFERLQKWNEKLKNSKYVVDLHNKLLVFLEVPKMKTFNILRPILSHDKPEISYKFTDRSGKGQLRTQHVVIRGWPATIFCTTDVKFLEDLATRSVTATPKTTKTKLRAACELIGEDAAFPWKGEDKEAVRFRLHLQGLQGEIEKLTVVIPYAPEIGKIIPLYQPRIMRDFKHILAFIKLNALVNHKQRPKLGDLVLATYEDFKTVLDYFEYCEETTVTGLGLNILNVFSKAMVPLGEFTYAQLVMKCKDVLDRPLSSSTLRNYVCELAKVGYIDEQPNPLDKRTKIISVIKQEENLSEYVRTQFRHVFTLESFKAWLKQLGNNLSENAENTYSTFNVEDVFNEHYFIGKTDNVISPFQDTIVYTEEQASLAESALGLRQNY